ncbi:MAG: hypothetical protein FWC55_04495 [Firmicutes bacterium]|nr:hypothetical protein [Bacillota bacterium]
MASERVIVVKGDQSKWFEQAIFIVKRNIPQARVPVDFVEEAERIIDGYLKGTKGLMSPGPQVKTPETPETLPPPQVKITVPRSSRALNAVTLAGVLILTVLVWFAFKG